MFKSLIHKCHPQFNPYAYDNKLGMVCIWFLETFFPYRVFYETEAVKMNTKIKHLTRDRDTYKRKYEDMLMVAIDLAPGKAVGMVGSNLNGLDDV